MEDNGLLYKNESFSIIGAALEVHKVLGCGFIEVIYQEALEEEFKKRNIPFEREKELLINYKGKQLSKTFRADFICYNKIIIELKAVSQFTDDHYAQLYSYLKASNLPLGILINFGKANLDYYRLPASKKWQNNNCRNGECL